MKLCRKCNIEKDESEFHTDNKSSDGLGYWCKECKKEYRKNYYKLHPKTGSQWDSENPDRAKERHKKYSDSINKFDA